MTKSIQFNQAENGIATLTFNRPEAMNALTIEAMQAFQEIISNLADDPTLRVLILTGAGEKSFCSGGDLVELREKTSEEEALAFITTMSNALLALERLPVPVIAAINGYALGGGSEIALACDIRIVDEHVKMGLVQIKMAVTPGWGAGQRLLRLVGYSKAMELLIQGSILHADDLLKINLANQIVAPGQALSHAQALAEQITTEAQETIRGIKALLQAGLNQPYEEALQTERAIFPPLWASQAHLEAVQAFFDRKNSKHRGSS